MATQTFTSSDTFALSGKIVTKIQVWSAGADGSTAAFGPGGSGGGYAEISNPTLVGTSLTITFEGGPGALTAVSDNSGDVARVSNANGQGTPGFGIIGSVVSTGGQGGGSDGITTGGGGGGCGGPSGNGQDGTEGVPGTGGSGGGTGAGAGGDASILGDGANGGTYGGGGGGSLVGNGGLGDTGAVTITWTTDTTPPTLGTLATNTAGTVITGVFSETVNTLTTQTGHFTLGGTSATVTSWSTSGTSFSMVISGPINQGETVTLSYDGSGGIHDTSSNDLAAFTDAPVTNNSTHSAGGTTARQKYMAAMTTYGFIRRFFKRN